MHAHTITGVVGKITWSYFNAAAVNGYTVTRVKTAKGITWTLAGTVVAADRYKLSQRPLVFTAPYDHGVMRWPIVYLDIEGGRLIADLGPPLP